MRIEPTGVLSVKKYHALAPYRKRYHKDPVFINLERLVKDAMVYGSVFIAR